MNSHAQGFHHTYILYSTKVGGSVPIYSIFGRENIGGLVIFSALEIQNRGERKHWRIRYQPPNPPPKFSPANVLCYTVAT